MLFADIEKFNEMQATLFDDCVCTDASLLVVAPTGCGKTTVFLLAMLRELMKENSPDTKITIRMVYIAPTRALCSEVFDKWEEKFSQVNIRCCEVTGETNTTTDLVELERYHVILTTPEKWDSLTRRWRENINFLTSMRLVMIDEIHLLNEARRGAALEATICRMKIGALKSGTAIRLIGISATLVNVQDVAKWFGEANTKAYTISTHSHGSKVKEKIISVPLEEEESFFKVDAIMNSWLPNIVIRYWECQPTLVFCGTRMSAEATAQYLVTNFRVNLLEDQVNLLCSIGERINYGTLRECIRMGIGFHHGGLTLEDRLIVENLYRSTNLPILVCTQTLAMGVNFPAHLVIVKAPSPISPTEMLQMLGRAGRVGLTSNDGIAVILTRTCHAVIYQNLREKIGPIESNLHNNLEEYINAEIFTGNIVKLESAIQWIKTTLFYVRLHINPTHYGFQEDAVENQLSDLCQTTIESLKRRGLISENVGTCATSESINAINSPDNTLSSTIYGSLAVRYFLHLKTVNTLQKITGREKIFQLFDIVCKCSEFEHQFVLRNSDKKILNKWNEGNESYDTIEDDEFGTGKSKDTLRFPISGKINSIAAKVSCLLQAMLGKFNVKNTHLHDEGDKMMKLANHLTKCIIEMLKIVPGEKFCAFLSALRLLKCFTAELWEDSPYVSIQLPEIDERMAQKLANCGKCTFEALRVIHSWTLRKLFPEISDIGRIIEGGLAGIPQYSVNYCWIGSTKISVKVHHRVKAHCDNERATVALIVGDAKSNSLLFYSENVFEKGNSYEAKIDIAINFTSIHIHLIHLSLVGVDVHIELSDKDRYSLNASKLNSQTEFVNKSQKNHKDQENIPSEPRSLKILKMDQDNEAAKDGKTEALVMEMYKKSLDHVENDNPEDPFALGVEDFFKQLESNMQQRNTEMEINAHGNSKVNLGSSAGNKDFKSIYEHEMTSILKKPYQVSSSRNLKSEFYKKVEKIVEEDTNDHH
ncbi:probable ATP-dependent DNA helicase HFM1 [Lutzomyia longipalpis]|uniref:probable ATP-dependent DNA helicase HFM1 n=1 Tax=Lutzomyia longipalpis TaxID=7200 RepID=UPI00248417D5|nr:probable ATP-dependent DNA helicase HFM1 [Lutzomyia longipalpis]